MRAVRVVFIVEGAADPVEGFGAQGVRFLPVAAGPGEFDARISCFHFAPGSHVNEAPFFQDSVLLVVYGELTLYWDETLKIDLLSGMGAALEAGEANRLESTQGAIVLAVESPRLVATKQGISTPARIMANQHWPTDPAPRRRRSLRSVIKTNYYRIKLWRMYWAALRSFLARSFRAKDGGSSRTPVIAERARDDSARKADLPRAE
jgi:hypothetical protein